MYLPPGSTLLRFLQLPILLSSYDRSTPPSAKLDEQCGGHPDCHPPHHNASKHLNHFGNLSPYHDAPPADGVNADLPSFCTVDQVILLHRHGSRGPTQLEEGYIDHLFETLDRERDTIEDADLPPELEFLREYEYDLVPEQLTLVGRKELLDHGVEFALRYPTFTTDEIVTTDVERVKDSAYFFAQGFFGRDAKDVRFSTTKDCDECQDQVSWLDTWNYCPNIPYNDAFQESDKWAQKYIPQIVERLAERLPDVKFEVDDIHGALYACPYDLAARNKSPWCEVFTADELRSLEYEIDLFLDGISGRDVSRGDPGPLAGAIYIKKLADRLNDQSDQAKSLYLEFAHDFTILLALSTMGLDKDDVPLTADELNPDRKFRSSYLTPFAASMTWERFTCEDFFEGPQVRLLLNGVTKPLTMCQRSSLDKRYGTCSVAAFEEANRFSTEVEYNGELWVEICGRGGSKEAGTPPRGMLRYP